jgi:hypothetical protein
MENSDRHLHSKIVPEHTQRIHYNKAYTIYIDLYNIVWQKIPVACTFTVYLFLSVSSWQLKFYWSRAQELHKFAVQGELNSEKYPSKWSFPGTGTVINYLLLSVNESNADLLKSWGSLLKNANQTTVPVK